MNRILLTLIMFLTACTHAQEHQQNLALPDVFLGDWIHEEGRFRMSVKADGTIQDIYIQGNKLIDEYQYKVVHIYDPERALILYKRKHYDPHKSGEITKYDPRLSIFRIDRHMNMKPEWRHKPHFIWGEPCTFPTEDHWQNLALILDTLSPEAQCLDDYFMKNRMWAVDDSKWIIQEPHYNK